MKRLAIIVLSLPLVMIGCEVKDTVKETTTVKEKEPVKKKDAVKEKETAKEHKPAGKTVKVTKGLCKVDVSLKGELAAGEVTEVRFSPKDWSGPFIIRKIVEHGAIVNKGDVLVELDPEKLDHALRDLETELRLSELAIHQTEAEIPVLEKLMPVELAEAERLRKQAVENQERYLKIDVAHTRESIKESVKSATHWVEYAREELKQLQKMYRDKDLTEETEEIILKRQKHYVESAEFYLKSIKLDEAEMLEVTLPRKEIAVRDAVQKLTLAADKAQATLPLALAQKKLALEKLKQDQAKSHERHAHLKLDRAKMTLTAPTSGIVFYGRAVHGQFAGVPNQVAQMLVVGGNLMPEMVFMSVTSQRPTLVYAMVEEKDLGLLRETQVCRVTPTGYPDLKLPAKLKARELVRLPTGSFLAVVALGEDTGTTELRPAMNCTVKVPVYEKANALLVPTAAIQHEEADESQAYVNLVDGKGKHVKRLVETGKTMGTKTEVLKGLSEGDEILAAKPQE